MNQPFTTIFCTLIALSFYLFCDILSIYSPPNQIWNVNFELDKLCEYEIDLEKVIINGSVRNQDKMMKYIDSGALVIIDAISQLQWIQNIDYPV